MQIVVIGNGVAGEAACAAIRSRSPEAGITLVSEDPSPFYSACCLARYISGEMKRSDLLIRSPADYEREGIRLLLGRRVEEVDVARRRVFLRGGEIAYDRLILATGSRSAIPPLEGSGKGNVQGLKTIADADLLFQAQGTHAVIVGSGPIGIELAVALRKRNWKVCLIEGLEWILPNLFDERAAAKVQAVLERGGIEVRTGEKVLAIEGRGQAKGVATSRGGSPAEIVALTVGMRPNVDLARKMGVEIGRLGGIRTNKRMQTNVPDVFACGDCVETEDALTGEPILSFLWPPAERQGRVAGANSTGGNREFQASPRFMNLDIFGTFAGAMGLPLRLCRTGAGILEKERDGKYHSLVLAQGRLMGAQFVGYTEGMGVLLSLLGREAEQVGRRIRSESEAMRSPWYSLVRI